jgi:hypothetical protein
LVNPNNNPARGEEKLQRLLIQICQERCPVLDGRGVKNI